MFLTLTKFANRKKLALLAVIDHSSANLANATLAKNRKNKFQNEAVLFTKKWPHVEWSNSYSIASNDGVTTFSILTVSTGNRVSLG